MPTIQINPNYILELGTLPMPLLMWRLFLDGGWIPVLYVLVQGFWLLWVQSRQNKFGSTLEFCLLAINVPKITDQTPKAAEQIFAHLAGAYSGFDAYEKYWEGRFNPSFSFEIVSLDGYVQYYVHCPRKARDLIEAAIYAQYPEAEINEVSDFAAKVPTTYPNPEWDAFGTEYVLKKESAYPLKTWEDFEHKDSEVPFKDPLAAVLEMLGSLRPGEQFWLQFRVTPTDDSWSKKGQDVVDKILGKKKAPKKSFVEDLAEIPLGAVQELTGIPLGASSAAPEKKEEGKVANLSPREKKVLEKVQDKLSQVGFMCKIRVVYVARRDVFNKGRLGQLRGAFSQFQTSDMNALKGYGPVTPKGDWPWQRWSENDKKAAVVRNYKNRSGKGATSFALSIAELATLYHFPMTAVKAPLMVKTEAKRAEPPTSLPTEDRYNAAFGGSKPKPVRPPVDDDDSGIPGNLPVA